MNGEPKSVEELRAQVQRAQDMVSRLSIELGEAVRTRDKLTDELRAMTEPRPGSRVDVGNRR